MMSCISYMDSKIKGAISGTGVDEFGTMNLGLRLRSSLTLEAYSNLGEPGLFFLISLYTIKAWQPSGRAGPYNIILFMEELLHEVFHVLFPWIFPN